MFRRAITSATVLSCAAAIALHQQRASLIEIPFPALSPTMEQGAITEWSIKVGEELKPGDLWGKVETDKATVDFKNSSDEGFVAKLLVDAGSNQIKVGDIIALLAEDEEELNSDEVKNWKPEPSAAPAATEQAAPAAAKTPEVSKSAPTATNKAPPSQEELHRSGPAVVRVAAGLSEDKLASVTPSGKDGRFVKSDFAAVTTIEYKETGSLIPQATGGASATSASNSSAVTTTAVGGAYKPGQVFNFKINDSKILGSLIGGNSKLTVAKKKEASA